MGRFAIGGLVCLVGCGGVPEDAGETGLGSSTAAVVGGTAIHGPSLGPDGAVGALSSLTKQAGCTGTLVAPNKVLTAAH